MKNELILKPGQILWYCNRKTGELGQVQVKYSYVGEFVIEYRDKLYRLPSTALGTRLFFTQKGAANPSEIIENRKQKEKAARKERHIDSKDEYGFSDDDSNDSFILELLDYEYECRRRDLEEYRSDYQIYCAEYGDD